MGLPLPYVVYNTSPSLGQLLIFIWWQMFSTGVVGFLQILSEILEQSPALSLGFVPFSYIPVAFFWIVCVPVVVPTYFVLHIGTALMVGVFATGVFKWIFDYIIALERLGGGGSWGGGGSFAGRGGAGAKGRVCVPPAALFAAKSAAPGGTQRGRGRRGTTDSEGGGQGEKLGGGGRSGGGGREEEGRKGERGDGEEGEEVSRNVRGGRFRGWFRWR